MKKVFQSPGKYIQGKGELYKEVFTYIHDQCVYIPLTYSRTKAVYNTS